jgi:hypothetical protein
MNHGEVRWAILKLSDSMKFPPSYAEVAAKVRELQLIPHYKRKAEGRVKPKSQEEKRRNENARNQLKYELENRRISREEYDRKMKELFDGAKPIGEVLETAFGGRFKPYADLARRLLNDEISRDEYEKEKAKLDRDAKKD